MNSRKQGIWLCHFALSAVVLFFACTVRGQPENAPPSIPVEEQPEVLIRGPVHEAFAEPVSFQYEAGVVAPISPPANIEEIPPAYRPAGDEVIWVPGYWSWDEERKNYIWVSACWRTAPPNMTWVPGYWNPVSRGWEWVAGFWAPAGAQEIEYLPAPPPSESVDAPGPAPREDNVWVPPCWYWSEGHYVPRRGYWLAGHPNWIWVASHYVWTPRGYVFAEGHWDYPLEDRGVLFAPVYIPRATFGRRGYTYSPSIVIDIDVLSVSLFVSPRYSHYYFGDYYDDTCIQAGIYPWFDHTHNTRFYDPIYEHDRARFRRIEPRWEEDQRHDYDARRADKDLRPPRTYREMEARVAKAPEAQRKNIQVVQSLSVVIKNTNENITNNRITNTNTSVRTRTSETANPVKFEKITPETQTKIAKQATDVSKFREDRRGWESAAAAPKDPQRNNAPKGSTIPPKESKESKDPVPSRAPERKAPAAPLANPPGPAAKSVERKEPAAPPSERKPDANSPREVRAEHSEKVKIPTPPLAEKSKATHTTGKASPPPPDDEAKRKDVTKDAPKKDDKPDKRNE